MFTLKNNKHKTTLCMQDIVYNDTGKNTAVYSVPLTIGFVY